MSQYFYKRKTGNTNIGRDPKQVDQTFWYYSFPLEISNWFLNTARTKIGAE